MCPPSLQTEMSQELKVVTQEKFLRCIWDSVKANNVLGREFCASLIKEMKVAAIYFGSL